MEAYFERENEDLNDIVRDHFDRAGIRGIRRVGEELSRQRKLSLMEQRDAFETRNEALLAKLRGEYEAALELEKAKLREEYDEDLREREAAVRDEFSAHARREALELYREELDRAIAAKVGRVREKLLQDQRAELESLSKSKLEEKEREIDAARRALEQDFTLRQDETLRELEAALEEGARQARESLVEKLEAEADKAARLMEERWAERRARSLEELRSQLAQAKQARLAQINKDEADLQVAEEGQLRADAHEAMFRESAEQLEAARKARAAALSRLRAELETKSSNESLELQRSLQLDLERAREDLHKQLEGRLAAALAEEQAKMEAETKRKLDALGASFAQKLQGARQAYQDFRRAFAIDSQESAATADAEDDGDESGSADSEGESSSRAPAQPKALRFSAPRIITCTKEGERAVRHLLESLCASHAELVERLRRAQTQLSRVTRDLVAARSLQEAGSGDTAALRAELQENKRLVAKLFAANKNLKELELNSAKNNVKEAKAEGIEDGRPERRL